MNKAIRRHHCSAMHLWMVLALICVSFRTATASAQGQNAPRPNFVLLIGEGQGWSTLSVPMDDRVPGSKSTTVRTPNLDRIAQEGMRFTNFYAPSPRCTPSRAALFTGKSPASLHMTFVGEGRGDDGGGAGTRVIPVRASTEMPTSEVTIAELLKDAGYATAHFGKWHVGRTDPSKHGYDESDGPTSNGGPENVRNPNPKQAYASARHGMGFMERAVKSGKPFYLQIAQYAGKNEEDSMPETYAAVAKRLGPNDAGRVGAAAVAEDADITYGMILKKLEELGVANNTYIIYTTDHGTPGRNTPLSAGKGTVGDGGLRVPLLIKGPGVEPNTFARMLTTGVDLFPTIAELAGISVNDRTIKGLEGGSLVQVLKHAGEGSVNRPRQEFVVHFPHYDKDPQGPASVLYLGDFKLVRLYESGQLRLYNLKNDRSERSNLAREMPEKVAELNQRLTQYLKAVNAQMPGINPNPDPAKAAAALPGERRGGQQRKAGAPQKKGGGGRRAQPAPPDPSLEIRQESLR